VGVEGTQGETPNKAGVRDQNKHQQVGRPRLQQHHPQPIQT